MNLKSETKSSKEHSERVDEELQVNKVSSSVEETGKEEKSIGGDKQHGDEGRFLNRIVAALEIEGSCKSVQIRLFAAYHLQTCSNLLKQLAASL